MMAPLSMALVPPTMPLSRLVDHCRLALLSVRSLALLLSLLLNQAAALAAPVVTGTWEHAIAAFQPPKYPRGFTHFAYVNPQAPKGGTLNLSNPDRRSSFDKWNPYTVKGVAPAAMAIFVFETLGFVAMDEAKTMYGLVGEEILVAPDMTSVSWRIHPKARFSNGDPVTAADVVHSLTVLTSTQASPQYALAFGNIARAVAVDARTVRFDFKEPGLDALFTTAELPIFSAKWGGGKKFSEVITDMPIATGAYAVDKFQMPRRLELKRRDDYWAKDLPVRRGFFNFDRVVYRMYADQDVRREGFKGGEFDLYKEYRAGQWVRAHRGPKWESGRIAKQTFKVSTGSMPQAMQLNLRKPKFQDIRVREAIFRAYDFDKYNRYRTFDASDSLFNNTQFAAEGLPGPAELALLEPHRADLPKEVFGPPFRVPHYDSGPAALRDSLRRAQELLADAGWKPGPDGWLRNAAGEQLTLEMLEPSQTGRLPEFARNLKKLGIAYSERLVDFALFRRRLETFDFDMVIIVEPKFTLPDAGSLINSYGSEAARKEGSGNYRGVQSKVADMLIDRIAKATTLDDLRAASRALDRVVMWNHWGVPMLYSRSHNVSYWNRFGIPAVQADYMDADTMIEVYSQPWPLWTWWDKSLAPSQAPIPTFKE
jgi:peptide/nickel transport system substrate-binding protein/microcin C transport system substrate-binding protein